MAESEVMFNQLNTYGFGVYIKLVDGRELQISNKGKKEEQNYSVDILSLKDKSKKTLSIAWKWLIVSIIFLLVTFLLLKVLPDYLSANKNIYLGIILLVGIMGSLFSLIKFWKKTFVKQIFYSRNAHVPIITLCAGKPDKKTIGSFIDLIESRIEKFRSHMDIAEDKQLTGEMKMLRRLSDKGVITKKVYEKAKAKLFSGFSAGAA